MPPRKRRESSLQIDFNVCYPLMSEPAERTEPELNVLKETLSHHSRFFRRLPDYQRDMILSCGMMLVLNKETSLPPTEEDVCYIVVEGKLQSTDDSDQPRLYGKDACFEASEAASLRVTSEMALVLEVPADITAEVLIAARKENTRAAARGGRKRADVASDKEEKEKGEDMGLLPFPASSTRVTRSPSSSSDEEEEEEEEEAMQEEEEDEASVAMGGGPILRACEPMDLDSEAEGDQSDAEIEFTQPLPAAVGGVESEEGEGKGGKRGARSRGGGAGAVESREAKKAKPSAAKSEREQFDEEDDMSLTSEDRAAEAAAIDAYEVEFVDDPDELDPSGRREQRTRHQPLRAARGPCAPQLPEDVLEKEIIEHLARRAGPWLKYEFIPILDKKTQTVINPQFDFFKEKLPKAPEIIVFHGTTRNCAKEIQRKGFDIKQALQRGREGNNHIFFATDPRVADHYAKPSRMKLILPGKWQKNMIVSRLLLVREAHITTTGCTGGTVKVHQSALWCLRPIYRLRYYIENPRRKLKLQHLSKGSLEEDRGLLNQALKTHLITVSSTQVEDFNNFEKPVL